MERIGSQIKEKKKKTHLKCDFCGSKNFISVNGAKIKSTIGSLTFQLCPVIPYVSKDTF